MRREQIRDQIVRVEEERTAVGVNRINGWDHRSRQERLAERQTYLKEVQGVLDARLTQREYLSCADFDAFDVKCCQTCHDSYPHYEMWDVAFSDGRHAWVCDPIHQVLLCAVKKDPLTPEQEQAEKLLADIFDSRNSVTESIRAADSDAERLRATLMYVHHVYGRTRGNEPFELVFERAHELLRRAVAVAAESGQGLGPNSSSGHGS